MLAICEVIHKIFSTIEDVFTIVKYIEALLVDVIKVQQQSRATPRGNARCKFELSS